MDILDRIVLAKQREVERLRESMSLEELQDRVKGLSNGLDFKKAIESGECSVIAEVKKHSPSKGSLREDIEPSELAILYENNGAVAISVLTDREFFHGSPEYLMDIKKSVQIPVLRKDFLIDLYQIYEAKLMGADALLLIAGLLNEERLREYIKVTMSLGIWPLVEVHAREDLKMALASGAEIIGINNRDLKNFTTDIRTTINLAPLVPKNKTLISESGIYNRQDIERLMNADIHAFLVGEALMSASDPGLMLRKLAGRRESS
ncbi:MAG: indole-3-glycerol phosphate synthase TrpC [Syntrophales bacterium LBB04]|nr:indole-3-glycerol phosphate synthase TrpC [Syntrophales bacterium LBB04]